VGVRRLDEWLKLEELKRYLEGKNMAEGDVVSLPTAVLDRLLGMAADIGEIKGGVLAGAAENKRLADYQGVVNGKVVDVCVRLDKLEQSGAGIAGEKRGRHTSWEERIVYATLAISLSTPVLLVLHILFKVGG
jgi:hypothetical protein